MNSGRQHLKNSWVLISKPIGYEYGIAQYLIYCSARIWLRDEIVNISFFSVENEVSEVLDLKTNYRRVFERSLKFEGNSSDDFQQKSLI